MELKQTPLYEEHKRLDARMLPFSGWMMPIQYSGILAEHKCTRKNASIFDTCHMGEIFISGSPTQTNLENILTVNLNKIKVYSCRYCSMLNENGGVIDDLLVYKISADKFILVVNAARIEKDEEHIRKNLAKTAICQNLSDSLGKIDIQGPCSCDILCDLITKDIFRLKYYHFDYFDILGEKNIISRTGYTGELGYEIFLSNEKIGQLWALLLKDKRLKPAGLGARDTLRMEMGYSLYGEDIDQTVTPQEAGLEKFVDFNKDFIGRDALLKQKEKGLVKERIYFMTVSRRSPRHNYKIYTDGKEIGYVTSGTFAPSLSCGIGMGFASPDFADLGRGIVLKEKDTQISISGIIVEKPFYKNGSLRLL
ncbi:MAG: glycine cleavage system aminomethyltransferase GcvT [Candidatus Omnitrophica bacterium]|nr:glycine cleavage system aminomethyltransferase GcvT [Candidatus Omnitrophota bacterium]